MEVLDEKAAPGACPHDYHGVTLTSLTAAGFSPCERPLAERLSFKHDVSPIAPQIRKAANKMARSNNDVSNGLFAISYYE